MTELPEPTAAAEQEQADRDTSIAAAEETLAGDLRTEEAAHELSQKDLADLAKLEAPAETPSEVAAPETSVPTDVGSTVPAPEAPAPTPETPDPSQTGAASDQASPAPDAGSATDSAGAPTTDDGADPSSASDDESAEPTATAFVPGPEAAVGAAAESGLPAASAPFDPSSGGGVLDAASATSDPSQGGHTSTTGQPTQQETQWVDDPANVPTQQ